jgi:hypothetical protein
LAIDRVQGRGSLVEVDWRCRDPVHHQR